MDNFTFLHSFIYQKIEPFKTEYDAKNCVEDRWLRAKEEKKAVISPFLGVINLARNIICEGTVTVVF
jgi:hypothetical protein